MLLSYILLRKKIIKLTKHVLETKSILKTEIEQSAAKKETIKKLENEYQNIRNEKTQLMLEIFKLTNLIQLKETQIENLTSLLEDAKFKYLKEVEKREILAGNNQEEIGALRNIISNLEADITYLPEENENLWHVCVSNVWKTIFIKSWL